MITNYSCNNRCCYCYASEGCRRAEENAIEEIMDFGYACEVLEELKTCGAEHCLLIGGEPTFYPELIPLIRFGTDLGLKMKLVSNGRKLSDRAFVRKLKRAGIVHSSVSIEGSTASIHNEITGTKSFEESCQGVVNLLNEEISCNTILTVSLLNIDDIVGYALAMHGMGVKNILYNFSLPSIDKDGIVSCYSPNPQECADAIRQAYHILRGKRVHISFFATIPLCLIDEETRKEMVADKTIGRNYHCHIFYGTGAAFEPNGNVLPCTHFVNSPLFNAKSPDGHFSYKGQFAQEWEKGIHRHFIEVAWRYPSKECKSCDLWGHCLGGCPFLWMHFKPGDYIKK
jgi:radical SAM protein with 4Fe4S-binding SPASM domain